jgi:hypothetical protein
MTIIVCKNSVFKHCQPKSPSFVVNNYGLERGCIQKTEVSQSNSTHSTVEQVRMETAVRTDLRYKKTARF